MPTAVACCLSTEVTPSQGLAQQINKTLHARRLQWTDPGKTTPNRCKHCALVFSEEVSVAWDIFGSTILHEWLTMTAECPVSRVSAEEYREHKLHEVSETS